MTTFLFYDHLLHDGKKLEEITSKKVVKVNTTYILYKLRISVGIELEQEADSFKISANMPCSKKFETS